MSPGKVFPWHMAGHWTAGLQSCPTGAAPRPVPGDAQNLLWVCTHSQTEGHTQDQHPTYLAEAAVASLLLLLSVFLPALPRWNLCFPVTFFPFSLFLCPTRSS